MTATNDLATVLAILNPLPAQSGAGGIPAATSPRGGDSLDLPREAFSLAPAGIVVPHHDGAGLHRKLKVLDLFSGIGGFSLGLERTGGFETVAFCEIEEFPRRVLANHWPKVPCYHDVRELTAAKLAADGIAVDVICGGFPCQGISIAGAGLGLSDPRSGLWSEFARIIREVSPRFVIIENSPKLRSRGLHTVLSDLDALGFNAEWHCIPAAYGGAPHRRDRIWIVAHRASDPFGSDADCFRPYPPQVHIGREIELQHQQIGDFGSLDFWRAEPSVDRVADGLPSKLGIAELASIGSAVVPQVVELIGRAIMSALDAPSQPLDDRSNDGADGLHREIYNAQR